MRRLLLVLPASLLAALALTAPAGAASPDLVISEVYGGGGNTGAPLNADFIELFNRGTAPVELGGRSLQYASASGTGNLGTNSGQLTELPSRTLLPGESFLVREASGANGAALPTPDLTDPPPISLSATAGKVALAEGSTTLGCNGGSMPCSAAQRARIIDLVGFGAANFFEGRPAPAPSNTTSVSRVNGGCQDTDDNAADFAAGAPAPRNSTAPRELCPGPPPNAAVAFDSCPEEVTLPVSPGSVTRTITASDPDGTVDAITVASAGPTGASVGPTTAETADAPARATLTIPTDGERSGTVTLRASNTDATEQSAECAVAVQVGTTPISEVQGSGSATPLAGRRVIVEGIVTGDLQGAAKLDGVVLQDPVGDGDAATSEGIFVFDPSGPALAAGDRVQITGTATEFNGLTQIDSVTARTVLASGQALPVATPFALPADTAARERLEGMRIFSEQPLTVTESRNADRFGELRLSAGGPLTSPTEIAEPGAEANAVAAENARRNVILDDARSPSNPRPVPYLSPNDSLRRGDTTTGLTGILSFGFGQYRVQPTAEPVFVERNPRPAAPDDVGGDLQIASFNVLNYFITFGRAEDRGADDAGEFAQQEAKIVDAINTLGAEVVALQEIQDTSDEAAYGGSPDAALDLLVEALNDDPDRSRIWAKVPAPTPYTNTDEIRNALIYQPARVARVGAPGALNDTVAFANARTPLSQTFSAGPETFTVIANHFKSKGSGSGENADQGDGQGASNVDRVKQATALLDYIRELEAVDPDVLALGDLNSYTKEDPIDVLVEDGGLIDVASSRVAEADRYSFVFDGAQGNLDHEIATPALDAKITGADIWHINSDEPDTFQYTGPEEFFAADAFAASDHDPSLVGLETDVAPTAISGAGVAEDGTRFDLVVTDGEKEPAGRAAFMTPSGTQAGEVTCVRRAGDRAVFAIADTQSGETTVYREFYVEDDDRDGDRLVALATSDKAPKRNCSSSLARRGTGDRITAGSITFAGKG